MIIMFDKETITFLRDRFEKSLKPHGWETYGEQLFCDFLLRNGKQILRKGIGPVKERLKGLQYAESRLGKEYLKNRNAKKCLIAGDEFGFLSQLVPGGTHLFYSKDSCESAKDQGIKNPLCLEELSPDELKFETVVILQLMGELKEREKVREIGTILKKFYSCMSSEGELVISDRTLYQDDFVTHFVSIGAEIASIEHYGEMDFFLRIRP